MRRRLRPALLLGLLTGLLLAGCAQGPSPEHLARMNATIGLSETELIRAWGVPSRTVDSAGGHRFLAYVASQVELWPAAPYAAHGYFFGGGYGGGFPPQVVQWRCETTFELVAGRVAAWTQHGNNC